MRLIRFIAILLLAAPALLHAQVLINEYSASNLEKFKDNYDKTEDWIELFNAGDQNVDLTGWYLSDKQTNPDKWPIPSGTVIPAQAFLVFWCSGRDESSGGHFHTNFKLTQTSGSDRVVLTNPQMEIVQNFAIDLTLVEHSRCRKTDGSVDWRICTNPGPGLSNNNREQYLSYTAKPFMDKQAGFYDSTLIVTIFNNELNSTLRYTLDGRNPSPSSPVYSEPIEVSHTTIIKARSFSNDPEILPGKMEFNTYFVDEDFTVAVFSVGSDDVKELANGNGGLRPIGSLEYFNVKKEREAISFGSLNRHGQDSWVLPHRSLDWISRDEMGYTKAVLAPLFSYSERDEYQRFMFRNSGDDNYPAINDNSHKGSTHIRDEYVQTLAQEGGLHLDTRAVERVVLFLNGEYWGLYGLRERPVDHDYTDIYYKQDKYNLHYLTTWGTTKAEYGGLGAFNDWYELRNFVLENDMSTAENYQFVKDRMDVISFMDYFIVNLNVVAKDWLNYNTAWWRGLNQEEDHTKWGYVLWDLDATFDYYINYTGIPNDNPDAKPCDINAISASMDAFFGNSGGGNEIEDPENCKTILDGSSPYTVEDSIFIQVINQDTYCCTDAWDNICQELYDNLANDTLFQGTCLTILNGSCPYDQEDPILIQTIQTTPSCCLEEWDADCQALYDWYETQAGNESVSGNVGKHEKIFIKLQEENQEFRELYYARQADLMNTVYSCENMTATLDRMVGVIEPEMPRQIERWGGTLNQWNDNIDILRNFIESRCELLDDGMVECFDVTGPYELTLTCSPEEVGTIGLNTIEPRSLSLPWTGRYFGNMVNKVRTDINEEYKDSYSFSHWESKSGLTQITDLMAENTDIELVEKDTLVAVYQLITKTVDAPNNFRFSVFPNPARDQLVIQLRLNFPALVNLSLYSVWGEEVLGVSIRETVSVGLYNHIIDLDSNEIQPGIYFLEIEVAGTKTTKRIVVVE